MPKMVTSDLLMSIRKMLPLSVWQKASVSLNDRRWSKAIEDLQAERNRLSGQIECINETIKFLERIER